METTNINADNDYQSNVPSLSPSDESISSSTSSLSTEQNDKEAKDVVGAAAVAGTVAGMALGGPALAIASGAGVAYAASMDQGCCGNFTRSTGKGVLKLKDKVEEWEEKHHYVENAAKSAKQGVAKMDERNHFLENASQVIQKKFEQAQEYEESHHVLEKIREFTEDAYRNVVGFADDHMLVERSKAIVTQGTAFAVLKVRECVRPNIAIDAQTEPRTDKV
jgi:hypothetical protein